MSIGIASDHGGYSLKSYIQSNLTTMKFIDYGTNTLDSVHYPLIADKLCQAILAGDISRGILICGTGIGISIRANRYQGIRAALAFDEFTAEMAKAHNNANILCLGGRTTSNDTALKLITTWATTRFEGGRHATRVELLDSTTIK
ncbi:MAG: ribose 5-phosphate isomerase B [Candidatus Margulisiibacteriota bacterium]